MKPVVHGVNHRTAPLEVRERLAVPRERLPEALRALARWAGTGVILSTCNRTEFYTLSPSREEARRAVSSFVEEFFGFPFEAVASHFYAYEMEACARHLFRVASGLDSLILGESEILGQVRDAFGSAVAVRAVANPLSRLFHHALRVGKRVRQETGVGRHPLSVSFACVDLARRALGDLRGRRALVVGAGEAGKLAARALRTAGAGHIWVTNRTFDRAREVASALDGEAVPFPALPEVLRQVDIVISCTGAPQAVLTAPLVASALDGREGSLFLLDIAVPRDVEPAVASLPGVVLYTIDDLEAVAESNRRRREAEARRAEALVEEEVERFREWWEGLAVVPTIAQLRQQAEAVRQRELARALKRLPGLSEGERAVVEALTRSLVQRLLHTPITTLRASQDPQRVQVARELFGLDRQGEREG